MVASLSSTSESSTPQLRSEPTTAFRVSVILPIFNEAAVIEQVCERIIRFGETHSEYEFLFVDDGSTDDTEAILRQMTCRNTIGQVRLIRSPVNCGKGMAIRLGAEQADSEFLVMMDGDLAYSLDLLEKVVTGLEDSHVVIGVRPSDDPRTVLRAVLGNTFNKLARLLFRLPHLDTQAGIKGFRRQAAREIFSRQRRDRFASDVEMIVIARRCGLTVSELPVTVDADHQQKHSSVHPVFDSVQMLIDLALIRLDGWLGRYG